jgi:hypothetical protein
LEPEVIFILVFVPKPRTRGSFDSEIFQKPITSGYYKIKEPPNMGAQMCWLVIAFLK